MCVFVVDVSISGRPDNKDIFDSPSSIIPDIDSLQLALADLMRDISDIDEYVDHVLVCTSNVAVVHVSCDSTVFAELFGMGAAKVMRCVTCASQLARVWGVACGVEGCKGFSNP